MGRGGTRALFTQRLTLPHPLSPLVLPCFPPRAPWCPFGTLLPLANYGSHLSFPFPLSPPLLSPLGNLGAHSASTFSWFIPSPASGSYIIVSLASFACDITWSWLGLRLNQPAASTFTYSACGDETTRDGLFTSSCNGLSCKPSSKPSFLL